MIYSEIVVIKKKNLWRVGKIYYIVLDVKLRILSFWSKLFNL